MQVRQQMEIPFIFQMRREYRESISAGETTRKLFLSWETIQQYFHFFTEQWTCCINKSPPGFTNCEYSSINCCCNRFFSNTFFWNFHFNIDCGELFHCRYKEHQEELHPHAKWTYAYQYVHTNLFSQYSEARCSLCCISYTHFFNINAKISLLFIIAAIASDFPPALNMHQVGFIFSCVHKMESNCFLHLEIHTILVYKSEMSAHSFVS